MKPVEFTSWISVPALRWWLVFLAIVGVLGLDRTLEVEYRTLGTFSEEAGDDRLPGEKEFVETPTKALWRSRGTPRSIRLIGPAVDSYPRFLLSLTFPRVAAGAVPPLPGAIASSLLRC
jgi:hypothetical protein